jgi:polyvinyl alcohol dehydrogenase (cytochrome)
MATVALAALAVLAGCTSLAASSAPLSSSPTVGPWDWPTYGHDAQHTFAGRTTLTAADVKHLDKAWFFPTGDAVTATPTVVDGTVYVGSWDTWFYAIDLANGHLRWKYHLSAQHAVTPYPGEKVRDESSDGGLVTSSAWFEPAADGRPALVIFGGGYTLYALVASTGRLFWRHDYPGLPGPTPDPSTDGARIFSSPVVVDGKVVFGVDTDGQPGSHGYVVAADVNTGDPVWVTQTDAGQSGNLLYDGCGSVWSSGTVLPQQNLVVFGTADCHLLGLAPLSEAVIALRLDTGAVAWVFHPNQAADKCDDDFGATPNAGLGPGGRTVFLGDGSKNGTYYSLDPATGALRWSTNVVFGGFSGGFIGTAAYDGGMVVGSTALGDYGRFGSSGPIVCDPGNRLDTPRQEPTVHGFDATTGAVTWQSDGAASFAPTTLAGGMAFNDPALEGPVMDVRQAGTGKLLAKVPLVQESWSGIATVGDAVVVGTGTDYSYQPSGIEVLTPGGAAPSVPAH